MFWFFICDGAEEEDHAGGDDCGVIDVEDVDPIVEDDLIPGGGPVFYVFVEMVQDFGVFVGEFVGVADSDGEHPGCDG